MNIERIDNSRIIVSLCNKDMEKFSVTFETLNLSDIHSRKVLKEILCYASYQTGIQLKNKKILIEAMQYEHGCILLITLSDKNKKRKIYRIKNRSDIYIFGFENADCFLNCINAIYHIHENKYSSSAFELDGKYYLAVQPTTSLKSKYLQTVNEFSSEVKYGKINFEILKEHASVIASKNAVETIGKYF